MAKALNCEHGPTIEPCDTCDICQGIQKGTVADVIEIDAASNNGADDIRALRDSVKYMPSVGKYKVYIIDEVHMLSNAAFNALLKTLEEPPISFQLRYCLDVNALIFNPYLLKKF